HHEHRILHSPDGASDAGGLWIGKWEKEFRVLPDGPLGLLGGMFPGCSCFREFVVGLGQNSIPAGRVPPEIGGSSPRDIVNVPSAEAPGSRPCFWLGLSGGRFCPRDYLNHIAASCRGGQSSS